MQQPYLELRTKRELGTILSDSFTFIRINITPLWNVLLKTSGVFFVLTVLLSGLYQYVYTASYMTTDPLYFFVVLLLMMLGSVLFYASVSSGVYAFMQNYIETKGNIQEEVIIQNARTKIGHLVLLSVMCYMLIVLGFLFFVIPGIYFMVPVFMVFPVFCFLGMGKIDSIRAAFKLISGYWWVTFGTILVLSIVIGIISFVFQLPSTVYLGTKTFFSAVDGNGEVSGDFIYLLLATISSAASNLISIVMVVAFGLIYFDLDEEKNRTGIKAKLEELG
ncbi:hypothetical protein LZF95_06545 [Algoriphagus sp. AGSA1]|uniref:hypothetical protein n=1 Tax=Algoriphagus sp. AGSA1 TaxID=2907213 RepID=UPI001F31E0E2|nr:hypothetical protein [Algoriphagus sp. AGSA1]MCE7054326.1 hypothetical protein [Algoriphagus sp. AGSA1]